MPVNLLGDLKEREKIAADQFKYLINNNFETETFFSLGYFWSALHEMGYFQK